MFGVARCEKVLFLISQSFDRKLSLIESLSLRWHFFVCKRCQHEQTVLVAMRRLLQLYRGDADKDVSSSEEMLSEETKARIKEVLRERMRTNEKGKEKEKESDVRKSPSKPSTNVD